MKQDFTIRQGALDGVEAFLAVARHRNFRRAAAELGVTPSAMSQAVRTLEQRIGVPLFLRTTRSVGLTEAGERFFARARPAYEEILAARESARGLGQGPAGLLRLTVPRAVVQVLLQPLVVAFVRDYPDVQVEISAREELADLAAEGFDAGIRLGSFIAADMVAVRLTQPFPLLVVGSPAYLRKRDVPGRLEDLKAHACLRLRRPGGAIASWSFASGNRAVEMMVSGPLIANDFPMLLDASLAGMGLAQIPAPLAAAHIKAGKLVPLLERYSPTLPGMFLYYPHRHQSLPKLKAFIGHVKKAQAPVTSAIQSR
jgi:DNA-binding transcriptional LysR family regulator